MSIFEIGAFLIGLSAVFGYLNHKVLHLPHTIGLVLIALVASVMTIVVDFLIPTVHISEMIIGVMLQIDFHETLMNGMLSFMLFAGALHVDFSAFKSRIKPITVMAGIGTLISTFTIGGAMWALFDVFGIDMPFSWSLVLGALISPTDPVAVLGLFKTVKVPRSLEAKMAGESLFNDGVGVVVFSVVLAIALGSDTHGAEMGVGEVARLFFHEAIGGAILGYIAGYAGYRAMFHIDEHNVEVMITLAVVMVTYAVAHRLEMSGPIAMVVAGLLIGNKGMEFAVSENTRDHIKKFWSLMDEILNSILFLLIGLEVLVVAGPAGQWGIAALAIPVVLAARLLSVYLPLVCLSPWETFTPGALPILTWGGLRGGIAVALALSLPANEYKPVILNMTYAIVLFSIIVQGLTIKTLVEYLLPEKPLGGNAQTKTPA